MFVLESTYDGAGTIIETKTLGTTDTAADGQGFKFSSGKLTKAGATTKPAYISAQKATAGKSIHCVAVRSDQVWVADYVTATTNDPVVGTKYAMDSDSLNVNADATENGVVTVISVDTAKKKCRVKFE